MLDPRLAVSTEDSQAAQTTAAPQCVLQGEDGVGWDPHLMPGTEGRQAALRYIPRSRIAKSCNISGFNL